jgi:hypothetical protein
MRSFAVSLLFNLLVLSLAEHSFELALHLISFFLLLNSAFVQ